MDDWNVTAHVGDERWMEAFRPAPAGGVDPQIVQFFGSKPVVVAANTKALRISSRAGPASGSTHRDHAQ